MRVPLLVVLVALMRAVCADILDIPNCIGGATCAPGDTCCQDKSVSVFYGCCPDDNPICCPDHEYCCSYDYPICTGDGHCQAVFNHAMRSLNFNTRGGAAQVPAALRMKVAGPDAAAVEHGRGAAARQPSSEVVAAY